MKQWRGRSGVSEVISTVILAGMLLSVGAVAWSFSQSVTSFLAEDYNENTNDMIQEVVERFTIERAYYNASEGLLYVWINNYGTVEATLDVYATLPDESTHSTYNVSVDRGELKRIDIEVEITGRPNVSLKAHSRRQNNAYFLYK